LFSYNEDGIISDANFCRLGERGGVSNGLNRKRGTQRKWTSICILWNKGLYSVFEAVGIFQRKKGICRTGNVWVWGGS